AGLQPQRQTELSHWKNHATTGTRSDCPPPVEEAPSRSGTSEACSGIQRPAEAPRHKFAGGSGLRLRRGREPGRIQGLRHGSSAGRGNWIDYTTVGNDASTGATLGVRRYDGPVSFLYDYATLATQADRRPTPPSPERGPDPRRSSGGASTTEPVEAKLGDRSAGTLPIHLGPWDDPPREQEIF